MRQNAAVLNHPRLLGIAMLLLKDVEAELGIGRSAWESLAEILHTSHARSGSEIDSRGPLRGLNLRSYKNTRCGGVMKRCIGIFVAGFFCLALFGVSVSSVYAQGVQADKGKTDQKQQPKDQKSGMSQKDREDRYNQAASKIDREAEQKKEQLRDNPPKRGIGTDHQAVKKGENDIDKAAAEHKQKLKDHLDNPQTGSFKGKVKDGKQQ